MKILIVVIVVLLSVSGIIFFIYQGLGGESEQPVTREDTQPITAPIEDVKRVKDLVESRDEVESDLLLDLSNQGLTNVPTYVFERTDLVQLDLSGNALTGSLQAEVRHLQKLKVLDLSDNKMTGVPAEIGQLSNLEVLDLSNNQLTGLPYELGNLSSLMVLDLRGNTYAEADLERIKVTLPAGVVIRVD